MRYEIDQHGAVIYRTPEGHAQLTGFIVRDGQLRRGHAGRNRDGDKYTMATSAALGVAALDPAVFEAATGYKPPKIIL